LGWSVEIAAIDNLAEREHWQLMLRQIGTHVPFDLSQARQRAEVLVRQGLGVADAAHLAFAEQAEADFVTCDDRLLHRCRRIQPAVWCGTPVTFCDKENLR
jgi:predicted nucleic acid-binding protein